MKERGLTLNLILVIIFIITGGTLTFGFAWSNIAIPTPYFKFTESLFLIIYIFIAGYFQKPHIKYSNTIIKYYYYFLILLGIIAVKNILLDGVSIADIIVRLRDFYTIILVFPLIKLIKNRRQLDLFIRAIYAIAFISGVVYLYQFIFKVELPASSGVIDFGVYRINHPGFLMIIISFFLIIAKLFIHGYKPQYLIEYLLGLFFMGIFIISISRGVIISLMVGIFAQVYLTQSQKHPVFFLARSFLIIILAVFVFFLAIYFLPFNSSALIDRFSEGIENVQDNSGSYGTRSKMITSHFVYTAENYPLFGKGFAYKQDVEGGVYHKKSYNNPERFVGDATYQNILLISGYTGFFLWLYMLFKLIQFTQRNYKVKMNLNDRSRFVGIFGLLFFFILYGLVSNYFSNVGLNAFSIILALTFLFNKFPSQNINENSNTISVNPTDGN